MKRLTAEEMRTLMELGDWPRRRLYRLRIAEILQIEEIEVYERTRDYVECELALVKQVIPKQTAKQLGWALSPREAVQWAVDVQAKHVETLSANIAKDTLLLSRLYEFQLKADMGGYHEYSSN